mmetsp:Transcript_16805/g.35271  ORF Transcript_16805/g.35271 Transcript_16805/m.35271 type:complete len:164 (-) Transcript_16805:33-524(-)
MSTPNAGGTDPLTKRRSGSVGHTTMLKGTLLMFADGYHERTIRHNIAKEKKLRNGPSTKDSGWTHGSVSERKTEVEVIPTATSDNTAFAASETTKELIVAGSNASRGAAANGAFRGTGITRVCPFIGANPRQEGVAISTVAVVNKRNMFEVLYQWRIVIMLVN